MITRRRLLALATAGFATAGGCLDRTTGSDGPGTATTTTGEPDGQTPDPATEPTDSDAQSERTTATDDLPDWDPAWTLDTEYEHVLGVDAGPDSLFLTLNDEGGPSAVAALRRGEQSIAWEQSFDGEASWGNPGAPDDHRDQWGVVVADGAVYSLHGRAESYEWTALHALDAESGERRWSFRRERNLSVRGVRDGTVLATGLEFFEPEHSHDAPEEPLRTVLYGLDAASGDERWTASFDGVEDVAVGPETVVVATADAVAGIGLDGTERWQAGLSEEVRALATVGDVTVVATGEERRDTTVRGFGPAGTEQWSRSLSVASLFERDGRVYGFGRVVAALESDGTVAWQGTFGDEPTFSPSGDRLYTRSGRQADAVDAYDLPGGRRQFRFDAPSDDGWPVAATDDAVVAEAITPEKADFTSLFAVSAETGEPRAVYRPDHHVFDSEAVDGTVYTGFGGGTLVAFETGDL